MKSNKIKFTRQDKTTDKTRQLTRQDNWQGKTTNKIRQLDKTRQMTRQDNWQDKTTARQDNGEDKTTDKTRQLTRQGKTTDKTRQLTRRDNWQDKITDKTRLLTRQDIWQDKTTDKITVEERRWDKQNIYIFFFPSLTYVVRLIFLVAMLSCLILISSESVKPPLLHVAYRIPRSCSRRRGTYPVYPGMGASQNSLCSPSKARKEDWSHPFVPIFVIYELNYFRIWSLIY